MRDGGAMYLELKEISKHQQIRLSCEAQRGVLSAHCSNQLRLSEDDLIGGRQATLVPKGLISGLHCREFSWSRQTLRAASGDIVRADAFEIRREAAHFCVSQRVVLDIEHRHRKTCAHHGSAHAVHVDKAVDVAMRVHAGPGSTQLV